MRILTIASAGALGVLLRYGVESVVPRHGRFPWPTLVVNLGAALLVGLLVALLVHRLDVPMWLQASVFVGFLGGYSTFSTLSLEAVLLLEQGRIVLGLSYALGSVGGGILAVLLGLRLGRLIF
jgi:CrcB protein